MTNRKFGALRDIHDVRDRLYRASRRAEPIPLQVDLREWSGPIKDQGEEGRYGPCILVGAGVDREEV